MKLLRVGVVVLLVATAFTAGLAIRSTRFHEGTSRRILYYHDPMHPAYTSDKPGIAPDCGMPLEPVYAEDLPGAVGTERPLPIGTVRVTPDKQQLVGVRIGAVERTSTRHEIRTLGRVTADERRIYRINAFVSGSIRKTYSNSVGSLVRKHEPLATFYTRELRGAQETYLYALDPIERSQVPTNDAAMVGLRRQAQIAAEALLALGMTDTQIAALASVRTISQEMELLAPETGFVLVRNVSPGQRFDAGTELYRIGDLRRVWVLADLFQYDSHFVKPGQRAVVQLPQQNRAYAAHVSGVLPQFDAASRTLQVRLELDNPGYVLRPDMFVDVRFPVQLPSSLTVPADAVLDSGLRKTVFVDRGEGYFEPRRVETGWRFADRVQILSGLMEGERVVISGNFLIDSESRLKAAAAGMRGTIAKDPVCGMEIDADRARASGRVVEHDGQRRFFCSDSCLDQYKARR